jgi:hypothetical protein
MASSYEIQKKYEQFIQYYISRSSSNAVRNQILHGKLSGKQDSLTIDIQVLTEYDEERAHQLKVKIK